MLQPTSDVIEASLPVLLGSSGTSSVESSKAVSCPVPPNALLEKAAMQSKWNVPFAQSATHSGSVDACPIVTRSCNKSGNKRLDRKNRSVSFDDDAHCEYSVEAYSEIYGMHPNLFDFDEFGNKILRGGEMEVRTRMMPPRDLQSSMLWWVEVGSRVSPGGADTSSGFHHRAFDPALQLEERLYA